jgi:UDPglucose 6-dehydrogenase
MRIVMVGTGHVGLVSGACLADFGHQVVCIDNDTTKLCALQSGDIPNYEQGLPDLLRKNVREERLVFANELKKHVLTADAAVFHCSRHPAA